MRQINLKLEDEYKDKLEEIAEKNQRSVANQARVMIDDFYERVVAE